MIFYRQDKSTPNFMLSLCCLEPCIKY